MMRIKLPAVTFAIDIPPVFKLTEWILFIRKGPERFFPNYGLTSEDLFTVFSL